MAQHVRVSENFVPVSEFKAQAGELLKRIGDSRKPLVITQHGRPAGVLLSPAAYDELMDRTQLVTHVSAGLADLDAGRVAPHAAVVKRLRKKIPGR
jgi:prevent-host-death family protein